MASALAFAGVLAGCGDDVTVANPTTVTVTPATADLSVGGTVTLTAAVTTTNANKGVTWTSSDNAKATVDANGKVTAVAAGNATITATAAADAGAKASALINISASKGVRSVTVNPPNGIIKVGEFIQLGAQVDRDPGIAGTVTWTSSATAVATVDGTGKVTGVTNGSAVITAASTVDPSVTGTMALTVRPLQPAQVSVQKVTTGSTQTPVNPNNVAGQIDVTLNVDPGDQTVTKVEVILQQGTGPEIVACSQNLSVAESEALRMAGAFENVEAVDIVCSINTAQFDATNGNVTYGNGTYSLRARATVAGGTGNVASPSVPLIFNNQSGFIAMVDNTNNVGGPKSAINPTNGLRYIQGDVTLKLAAVNYTAGGATVTAVTGNFLGQAFSSNSPTGQIFTFTFTEEDDLDDYQTPLGSAQSIPVVTSSSLSSGTQGPTTVINVGATADNAGLARFDSVRVDNVEPAVPTLNDFPNWVRGAFTFDTTNAGVEDVEDVGVDNVTVKFFVIKGDLPDDDDCDVTGMTEVATAANLDETLTSIEYNGKVVITDALGNKRCVEFNNTFGVDKGAPEIDDLSAPAQGDIFANIAVGADDSIAVTVSDTLSGPFEPTPLLLSIRRRSSSSSNVCVVGATSACNQVASANPISSRGGSTSNGYYTYTVAARDSAGNATANTVATFLYDSIAPEPTGAQQQPATYTAGAAATFTVAAKDNIDLGAATGILTYAGRDTIEFVGNTLGTFGFDAFTTTGTASFTVPSFIRCLAANNDTTAAGGVKATEYNILINDLAGNSANVGNTAIPAIAVSACGTVGNSKLAGTGLTLTSSETNLSLDGDPDEKTTTLTARVETVASESAQPFTRVDFYVRNAAGRLQLIGTDASASVGPQGAIRPFSYTFNWTPTTAGAFQVLAIGVDAQGDAMLVDGGIPTVTVGP
jgi:hypothetical protein